MTEDERIFVCDRENDQILITDAGDQTSWSALDLSEHGCPQALIVQDGFLNVLMHRKGDKGLGSAVCFATETRTLMMFFISAMQQCMQTAC